MTYLWPNLLQTSQSLSFLGQEVTATIQHRIQDTKQLFPEHPFEVMTNYFFPSWFLFFTCGEKLYKRIKTIDTTFDLPFQLPSVLERSLTVHTIEWIRNQLLYNYILDHYRPLSQYFGGYM